MDESQKAQPEADECDWLAATLRLLDKARTAVETAMQGYNLALMAFAGVSARGASAMAITRPVPHGLPVLAIVPDGTSVATLMPSVGEPAKIEGRTTRATSKEARGAPSLPHDGKAGARRPRKT